MNIEEFKAVITPREAVHNHVLIDLLLLGDDIVSLRKLCERFIEGESEQSDKETLAQIFNGLYDLSLAANRLVMSNLHCLAICDTVEQVREMLNE